MFGRFLLMGLFASIGTAGLAAAPLSTAADKPVPAEQLRVTCTGTLLGMDQPAPGSRVMANGLIDFTGQRVRGFGIASQPIVVLTASEVDFGSLPSEGAERGNIVRGSINRTTGETHIVVRTLHDPSVVRIELSLDCEFEPPVS